MMIEDATTTAIHARLIDSLYTEAMVLADDARGYFDLHGTDDRHGLDPIDRVSFSCESLKVTTRLMHVIAWLLTQRAVLTGELPERDAMDHSRRLGSAPVTDPALLDRLPPAAAALVSASIDLHRRVARIEEGRTGKRAPASPARAMMERLAASF
jgi:regulator of CtrA degradation